MGVLKARYCTTTTKVKTAKGTKYIQPFVAIRLTKQQGNKRVLHTLHIHCGKGVWQRYNITKAEHDKLLLNSEEK